MASQNRNPEIRKDAVNNRWVIFSPARSRRPFDFKSKANPNPNNQSECPFCIGHEHDCAPEIFRVPPDPSSSWQIRVIQNLYPALSRDIEPPHSSAPNSTGDVAISGFGYHDVVIESPVHSVHLADLDPVGVGEVVLAYKKRIDQLRCHDSIKYIQVFKNHGASAGASMSHSHSQIMALPVVPPSVSARLDSMKQHFDQTGRCSLCDIRSNDLLIDESAHFISIVPFAAAFPFEIWIVPVDHSSHFHDIDGVKNVVVTREQQELPILVVAETFIDFIYWENKATDLGGLLKLMLRKISLQLNNPPFNFMIHTTPLKDTSPAQLPYAHWFLQIVPQLTGAGGFEMGTGCQINPVFPEDAAKVLREVCIPS